MVAPMESCSADEVQGNGIHAVAQTGWLRPIIENMAEMCIAARTGHRDTLHEETIVLRLHDIQFGNRLPETGPSGTRIELGCRVVECGIAADAAVDPRSMIIIVLAGARPLRLTPACNLVGIPRQLFTPFRVRLDDGRDLRSTEALSRR